MSMYVCMYVCVFRLLKYVLHKKATITFLESSFLMSRSLMSSLVPI